MMGLARPIDISDLSLTVQRAVRDNEQMARPALAALLRREARIRLAAALRLAESGDWRYVHVHSQVAADCLTACDRIEDAAA